MKCITTAALFFGFIFTCTNLLFAADTKNDPSQFPLALHVSTSSYAPFDGGTVSVNLQAEVLTATVSGKHYQLLGYGSHFRMNGLINPGDYHAKLVQDEHKTSYESLRKFEILFPDGTTRRFDVIAQSE